MATYTPVLLCIDVRDPGGTPALYDFSITTDATFDFLSYSEDTDDTLKMQDGSFSAGRTSSDVLINKPYIGYRPRFWQASTQLQAGAFEFGDPNKGVISSRYTKDFTQDSDTSNNRFVWGNSQRSYSDADGLGGIFDWSWGADWIQSDETAREVARLYSFFCFHKIIVTFVLDKRAYFLSKGDIILLKDISPEEMPSPAGVGVGSKGRRFQIVGLSRDYVNGTVSVTAIDAHGGSVC